MFPSFHTPEGNQVDVNPAHIECVRYYEKKGAVGLMMVSGNQITVRSDEWEEFTEAQKKRAEYMAHLEYQEVMMREKMLRAAERQTSGLVTPEMIQRR